MGSDIDQDELFCSMKIIHGEIQLKTFGVVLTTLALVSCGGGGGGGDGGVSPTSYTISATVSGLTGTGLSLQNNGGDNLAVSANGTSTFANRMLTGATYSVTILNQPSGQACSVIAGNGTVNNANVGDVVVSCVNTIVPLACVHANGAGANGRELYTPSGVITYQLSTSTAYALDTVTLGWGARYTGPTGSYTGSLQGSLWALSSSYSGVGPISGYKLGTFPPTFTGTGAFSATQILAGGYSINTIISSTPSYNPPAGDYCMVVVLEEYMPGGCTPNPNGYCMVDWSQITPAQTFR